MDDGWWQAILKEQGREAGHPAPHPGVEGPARDEHAATAKDWEWARRLYEADDTVRLNVIGYNRGGVLVEAQNLRGFVPVSHLISVDPGEEGGERSECLSSLVGNKLVLKVIEFDPERGRLVFSERAAAAGPGKRLEVLSSLGPGDRVTGKVTNITRFGVFVDLGGIEGLIHVSELSWGRVRHPSDVVDVGDELEVQVLSVDPDQGRVALSLKELQPDPWATVDERYAVGDILTGTVTNVVKFGAFVGVEDGLEGLIHISELGDGQFLHPRNVIEEGEQVRVRVVNIDAPERKLGLSLREVPQEEAAFPSDPQDISAAGPVAEVGQERDAGQEGESEEQASLETWDRSSAR
jgi:small subunit ribosomal protein S1